MALSSNDFPVPIGSSSLSRKVHIERRNVDVPAEPVKNTLFSSSTTIFNTLICSSFKATYSWTTFSLLFPLGFGDASTSVEKKESSVFRGCFVGRGFESSIPPVDFRFFET